MQTFTDMIDRVRSLQNETEALLQELEQARDAKSNAGTGNQETSEILPIMMKAKHSAIKEHCLAAQKAPVQEAYVVLLLTLAKEQAKLIDKKEALMYPCRIAAACPTIPDIEIMYAKALTGNEGTIDECLTMVQDKNLQYSLIFDAMIMSLLFDSGRDKMLELVAEMASLLAITENQMQELIYFTKGYMAQDEIVCKAFTYLPVDIVEQCLLRYCKKYVIAVNEHAVFHWESEEDHLSTIINILFKLLKKERKIPCGYLYYDEWRSGSTEINNITFGGKYYLEDFTSILKIIFSSNNILKIAFVDIFFTKEDTLFLNFSNIHELLIKNCNFINCQNYIEHSNNVRFISNGIFNLKNCINIKFQNCWFDNNRKGGSSNNFSSTALKLVDGTWQNLVVKDCKAPAGEVKDNTIPLK